MTDQDIFRLLGALVRLDEAPQSDPDRLVVNRTPVWRHERVLDEISRALANPLDMYRAHRQLVASEYISNTRFTTRDFAQLRYTWINRERCERVLDELVSA